ncbi:MAG: LysE family translocator [Bacteroidales bacterium]
MIGDLSTFLIFTLVTAITPGPNNISTLSFSASRGYVGVIPYMVGIMCGVFAVQMVMALALLSVSSTSFAEFLEWLRYVGVAYILYLAYKTLQMNVNWSSDAEMAKPKFRDGFLFQAVNPKMYCYTITILTTFVNYDCVRISQLFTLCLFLAVVTYASLSVWAGTGAMLKRLLQNDLYRKIFALAMALSLLYTAYKIFIP